MSDSDEAEMARLRKKRGYENTFKIEETGVQSGDMGQISERK